MKEREYLAKHGHETIGGIDRNQIKNDVVELLMELLRYSQCGCLDCNLNDNANRKTVNAFLCEKKLLNNLTDSSMNKSSGTEPASD